MFSANENIQLRQHKKRIVQKVEDTMSEEVLDLGVNVMVMQVSCRAPGCVPLETAIIIVFPPSEDPLIPGLPESAGGSFKTKILKPMAEVEDQDILEALPPAFEGGLRTLEKVALRARDIMLAQVEQIFENKTDKVLLAQYLQQSLQDYMDRDCQPPEYGEPFPELSAEQLRAKEEAAANDAVSQQESSPIDTDIEIQPLQSPSMNTTISPSATTTVSGTGNMILKRPSSSSTRSSSQLSRSIDPNTTTSQYTDGTPGQGGTSVTLSESGSSSKNMVLKLSTTSGSSMQPTSSPTPDYSKSITNTTTQSTRTDRTISHSSSNANRRRIQQERSVGAAIASSDGTLRNLIQQEHAPGIRRPGCPCCDPDNPDNVADTMLSSMY